MNKLLIIPFLLLLSACVTEGGLKNNADYKEAARLNTQLGVDYLRKNQLGPARSKLERAVEQDSSYAPAQSALATLYAQIGEFDLADKHFKRSVSLDRHNPDLKNNYGVFLCRQGKPEEAQDLFKKAATNPRYATPQAAWTNAGICWKQQNNLEQAEYHLRLALKIDHNYAEALSQMAQIAFERKNYLSARAFLDRYEGSGQPHSPASLLMGVRTEQALGDNDRAREYAMKLRRAYPTSEEAYILVQEYYQ